MPEDTRPSTPKPNKPTNVREPDNSRPAGEPTPEKPMKPEELGAGDEEPATEGM